MHLFIDSRVLQFHEIIFTWPFKFKFIAIDERLKLIWSCFFQIHFTRFRYKSRYWMGVTAWNHINKFIEIHAWRFFKKNVCRNADFSLQSASSLTSKIKITFSYILNNEKKNFGIFVEWRQLYAINKTVIILNCTILVEFLL